MTLDLFSFRQEPEGNYATRKILQWIRGDPLLHDGCRDIAIAWRERKNRERPIAEELRRFILRVGREDEPPGLFLDMLDSGLKEVDWQMVADHFLDKLAPP